MEQRLSISGKVQRLRAAMWVKNRREKAMKRNAEEYFFPSMLGYGHITNNMKQAEQFPYF